MRTINWDEVQEQNYITQEGDYTFKIVELLEGAMGNTVQVNTNGKEYHEYQCQTKDGATMKMKLYLSTKALFKYKKLLSVCGIDAKGDMEIEHIPSLLIGKKFIGVVKRNADTIDVATGLPVQGKYLNITDFKPVVE